MGNKKKQNLGIKHDGNGVVFRLRIVLFDQINNLLMRSMIPMRHVHPCNIHPSFSQFPYHLSCVGRRTNGAHNLSLPPHCRFRPHPYRCVTKLLHFQKPLQLLLSLINHTVKKKNNSLQ